MEAEAAAVFQSTLPVKGATYALCRVLCEERGFNPRSQ